MPDDESTPSQVQHNWPAFSRKVISASSAAALSAAVLVVSRQDGKGEEGFIRVPEFSLY
jgi:hypothetical protein